MPVKAVALISWIWFPDLAIVFDRIGPSPINGLGGFFDPIGTQRTRCSGDLLSAFSLLEPSRPHGGCHGGICTVGETVRDWGVWGDMVGVGRFALELVAVDKYIFSGSDVVSLFSFV